MAGMKDFLAGVGVLAGAWLAYRWVTGHPALPAAVQAAPTVPQLAVLPGGKTRDGEPVPDFEPVQFEGDSAEFPQRGHGPTGVFARWILDHPGWTALVVGHDAQGNQSLRSTSLSRERALVTADVLVRHGVPEDRVQIEAMGSQEPAAPDTEEGKVLNRRVEFHAVAP